METGLRAANSLTGSSTLLKSRDKDLWLSGFRKEVEMES